MRRSEDGGGDAEEKLIDGLVGLPSRVHESDMMVVCEIELKCECPPDRGIYPA